MPNIQTQQDLSLFITHDEFLQLDRLVGELPTKYGVGFINGFNLIRRKRATEEEIARRNELENSKKSEDNKQSDEESGEQNT